MKCKTLEFYLNYIKDYKNCARKKKATACQIWLKQNLKQEKKAVEMMATMIRKIWENNYMIIIKNEKWLKKDK